MDPVATVGASKALIDQGTLGALLVFVTTAASVVVAIMWKAVRESQGLVIAAQSKCDSEVREIWEARMAYQEKVLVALERNASGFSENNRVLESRAEALRALEASVTKLTVTYEGSNKALREQVNRLEGLYLSYLGRPRATSTAVED